MVGCFRLRAGGCDGAWLCRCFAAGGDVMSRGPQKIRQTDIAKLLKAAQAAGVGVRRIEINPDGKIVVVAGQFEPLTDSVQKNEWESVP